MREGKKREKLKSISIDYRIINKDKVCVCVIVFDDDALPVVKIARKNERYTDCSALCV